MRPLVAALVPAAVAGGSLKAIVAPKQARLGAARDAPLYVTGPGSTILGATGAYSIATLDETNGTILSTTPAIYFSDDGVMPGCNAAAAPADGVYWKTAPLEATFEDANASAYHNCAGCVAGPGHCCADPTTPSMTPTCFKAACDEIPAGAAGEIFSLGIDAATGAVAANKTFALPAVSPPFSAWDATIDKAWTVVPYSYTEAGLFLLDYANATATRVSTFAKGATDGIGVCEGRVFTAADTGTKALAYQFGGGLKDELRVVDLADGGGYAVVHPRAEDVGLVPGAARGPRGAARGAGLGRAVVHGVAGPVQGVAARPDLARERLLREGDRVAAAELLRVHDFDLRVVAFQTTKPSTRVSTVAFAGAPANVAVQPQAPS